MPASAASGSNAMGRQSRGNEAQGPATNGPYNEVKIITTNRDYLKSNATSHVKPFSAIAELVRVCLHKLRQHAAPHVSLRLVHFHCPFLCMLTGRKRPYWCMQIDNSCDAGAQQCSIEIRDMGFTEGWPRSTHWACCISSRPANLYCCTECRLLASARTMLLRPADQLRR